MKPDGKLFVHIFAHATTPYEFKNEDGWMATYFFSGGTMPDVNLFLYFQEKLKIEKQWWLEERLMLRLVKYVLMMRILYSHFSFVILQDGLY